MGKNGQQPGDATVRAGVKKPSFTAKLLRLIRGLAVVLLLVVLAVRLTGAAERLAYFPSRRAFETPAAYEDVWFETADGVKLHGWFMPAKGVAPGERSPAVLHAHGNAGTIASHQSFSNFLADAGMHVLIFDYRKYGRSDDTGPLRRERLVLDAQAALAALLARPEVDADRVGVMGVSLGGVFALEAAAQEPRVRAVATLSAFSSWQGVAADAIPVLGWVLMPPGTDPVDSIASLGSRPVLVMHGLRDRIVSPRHADILFQAAQKGGSPAELWTLPGGDHNALVQRSAEARARLVAFFDEHLGEPARTEP